MSDDSFEFRRTIETPFGKSDFYMIEKVNAYHDKIRSGDLTAIDMKNWPQERMIMPTVVVRDYVPFLVETFNAQFALVWDTMISYGLVKIYEEIDRTGVGANIEIYDMLRRNYIREMYMDEIPLTKPAGIMYEPSRQNRISESIKKKLFDLSRDIGTDNKVVCLLAISIFLKDSEIISDHFYNASEGDILSMSSKMVSNFKAKNIQMLDFFAEVSGQSLKTYNERIQSATVGNGMKIEGHRWALNRLRMRSKLNENVLPNPLKKEVIAYKKELKRIIIECIELSSGNIFANKLVKEMNAKRIMVKRIIRDNPFLSSEIKELFETFDENIDYMNRIHRKL